MKDTDRKEKHLLYQSMTSCWMLIFSFSIFRFFRVPPCLSPGTTQRQTVHAKSLQSCPTLCNPMTVAHQAPLSMGFSRQEHWTELPCPPPGDLPNPGTEPSSHVSCLWQFSCHSDMSDSATPWTAARQASLSIINSQSPRKPMSIESVMPSSHLIFCHPLLPPSVFPSIRVIQISQCFASGGQSIGVLASTSVLPINSQAWFPLGLTGWISLQSKGL